jgi:hypothetical protein
VVSCNKHIVSEIGDFQISQFLCPISSLKRKSQQIVYFFGLNNIFNIIIFIIIVVVNVFFILC